MQYKSLLPFFREGGAGCVCVEVSLRTACSCQKQYYNHEREEVEYCITSFMDDPYEYYKGAFMSLKFVFSYVLYQQNCNNLVGWTVCHNKRDFMS